MGLPRIIQGGMGVGVSGWRLARSVSSQGQLGVVSGTALAVILTRLLQEGDPDGHVRRALGYFPIPAVAESVLSRHYRAQSKGEGRRFKLTALPSQKMGGADVELMVVSNFVEVFLAKEGHDGVVGINYLEKIQFPTLSSIFGAILAGVDYVLMGAGIPRSIPGILDALATGDEVRMKLDVRDALPGEDHFTTFDPVAFCGGSPPPLTRPVFLAIVSSATLALSLARKATGKVDGFVVEGSTAGGHNAPPRGKPQLSPNGEPIYGPRDAPDFARFRELGVPFWIAGSYGHADRLREALAVGAAGVQVGTAFAFCEESGIEPELKQRVIERCISGQAGVFTDPIASPTGFPFKVVQLDGTMSEAKTYEARSRICDIGYLRHAYRKADGSVAYRCPAEPVADYVKKGGAADETVGRKCVCNGLLATIGLGQTNGNGMAESALVTAGDDLSQITRFLKPGRSSYRAKDVLDDLLGLTPSPPA